MLLMCMLLLLVPLLLLHLHLLQHTAQGGSRFQSRPHHQLVKSS
jgi:hypothetical protein